MLRWIEADYMIKELCENVVNATFTITFIKDKF